MKLKKHNTKKVALASLLVFGFFGLCAMPIIGSEMIFADTCVEGSSNEACMLVQVDVPEYISITNAQSIPSTIEVSNSTGLSSSQAVIVATNIPGGYKLTAKAISTNTSSVVSNAMLRRDGSGVAVSDTGINSTAAKATYANMANKTWGLAVDGTNFRPIATTASGSGIIAYSTAPVAASTTNVVFAAKVTDSNLVAGTYSATMQFTAVGNDGTAQTLYGD